MEEIARDVGCSRQYVHKLIKKFGIDSRSLEVARKDALAKKKLKFDRENGRTVVLRAQETDEGFFDRWSPEMAYVLGVVASDGNLSPGRNQSPSIPTTTTTGRLSIFQNERELLEKVRALMKSNTRILHRQRKTYGKVVAGEIYYFHINSDRIFDRLVALGIGPAKSNTIRFPAMPAEYERHFIRGCWDGDGSVFETGGRIYASLVSGSEGFLEDVEASLRRQGLNHRTIFVEERGDRTSFKLRYTGTDALRKLEEVLYLGVPPSSYLSRKRIRFHDLLSTGLKSPVES